MKNLLGEENTNLSFSQKELLLWHQCLSHASIGANFDEKKTMVKK
jgi:hypothetical protein